MGGKDACSKPVREGGSLGQGKLTGGGTSVGGGGLLLRSQRAEAGSEVSHRTWDVLTSRWHGSGSAHHASEIIKHRLLKHCLNSNFLPLPNSHYSTRPRWVGLKTRRASWESLLSPCGQASPLVPGPAPGPGHSSSTPRPVWSLPVSGPALARKVLCVRTRTSPIRPYLWSVETSASTLHHHWTET